MKKVRLEYAIGKILAHNIYIINKKNNEIGCILEKGVVLDLQDINEIKKIGKTDVYISDEDKDKGGRDNKTLKELASRIAG